MQHAWRGWPGFLSIPYHTYPFTSSYDVKDEVSFQYGAIFAMFKKPAGGLAEYGVEDDVGKHNWKNKGDQSEQRE